MPALYRVGKEKIQLTLQGQLSQFSGEMKSSPVSVLLTDAFTQKSLSRRFEQDKFSILLANCKNWKIPAIYPSTFNKKFTYTFWLGPQGVTHANGANFLSAMIIVCPHHLQNIKIWLLLDVSNVFSRDYCFICHI